MNAIIVQFYDFYSYVNSFYFKSGKLSSLLKAVILARTRCDVSLTALRNESLEALNPKLSVRKKRPLSAPSTRKEVTMAEQLTATVVGGDAPTTKPITPENKLEVNKRRPHTSHHADMSSPRSLNMSARSGVRGRLVPTPVNISNQGIESLRTQREFFS